jgi:putative tryptophan/tyrosine transport system substrate-binding protein
MKRRQFMAGIGGTAVGWPLAAHAQQQKTPTIGVLLLGNALLEPFLSDFRGGLRDKGHTEGSTFRLEVRTAGGKSEFLAEQAAELVRLKVDIIVAFQTPACTAAKQATAAIPIVMVRAGDPVATGLIASYARPGGNITGTSAGVAETVGNVVGLMHETMSPAKSPQRLGALFSATDSFTKIILPAVEATARKLGIETVPVLLQPQDTLEAAFQAMAAKQVTAVVGGLAAGLGLAPALAALAMTHRLPLFATDPAVPRAGGLMSYAASFGALHRETADYVDRMLKGAKPADLAVSFPTRFEMALNLKTAKTLGISIPQLVLARADEVIE